MTQEIHIAFKNTASQQKVAIVPIASPTHPVFHVLRTVCRRYGFRALHQRKRTALLQSDTGILVWAMWCGEQSVDAVSNWTREGGHLGSHPAAARAKQVIHDSCSVIKRQKLSRFVYGLLRV